jgi:hypothetical protein
LLIKNQQDEIERQKQAEDEKQRQIKEAEQQEIQRQKEMAESLAAEKLRLE